MLLADAETMWDAYEKAMWGAEKKLLQLHYRSAAAAAFVWSHAKAVIITLLKKMVEMLRAIMTHLIEGIIWVLNSAFTGMSLADTSNHIARHCEGFVAGAMDFIMRFLPFPGIKPFVIAMVPMIIFSTIHAGLAKTQDWYQESTRTVDETKLKDRLSMDLRALHIKLNKENGEQLPRDMQPHVNEACDAIEEYANIKKVKTVANVVSAAVKLQRLDITKKKV